jgi:MFS family permease
MRRWLMLGLGMAAQAAATVFLFGLPFLLPELHADTGLSLGRLGILIGCPSAGMLLALIAWGAAADRYGERLVMTIGLTGAGVLLVVAAFWHRPVPLGVLLVLAGAFGSSVNAASGRLVLGWFAPEQRGLAMGWRQTALPLGVAVAGVLLPPVALHGGLRGAFLVQAGICLATAGAIVLFAQDPTRPVRTDGVRVANPYRQPVLWRVHGASALLVVPQFVVSAFAVEYLVSERHWDPSGAGRLIAVAGVAGALARLGAGKWSDLVGSRLGPMRILAYVNVASVGLLALGAAFFPGTAVALLLVAGVVTVSSNGLAFTSVAELAGPVWAGRAMGAQNTVQNLSAAATPALWGGLVEARGYPIGYAVAALFPVVAAFVTPRDKSLPAGPAQVPPQVPAGGSGAEQRLAADPQHVARHAAGAGSGEEGDGLGDVDR